MKNKIILSISALLLFACGSKKDVSDRDALFEVLYQDEYAGNNFKFYEIITKENEFKMLLNDKKLKKKIKPDDIETSNFLLLNLGEKSSGGYGITVGSVDETATTVIVSIIETQPKVGENVTLAMTYPMCIVKINSKKEIVFKENNIQ